MSGTFAHTVIEVGWDLLWANLSEVVAIATKPADEFGVQLGSEQLVMVIQQCDLEPLALLVMAV